jgi:penicillin-binding protein 2
MERLVRTQEQRDAMVGRVRLLSLGAGALLAVVLGSYWVVQGVHGQEYRQAAEHNRLRHIPVFAPRGIIFDREGRPLAENVPSYSLLLEPGPTSAIADSIAFAASILERPEEELWRSYRRSRERYPSLPARIAESLTLAQVARFEMARLEHPELEISVEQLRLYRHREQTAHVLGYLSEINERELEAFRGDYLRGEVIGRKGVESQYEHVLRGVRGERVLVVDHRGRSVAEHQNRAPIPGEDIQLTLDLDLQQAAYRYMEDKLGAVVAMDPRSGEILALVSKPSFDPNLFARRLDPRQWQELLEAPWNPLQNRAIQNAHSPGSTFKIITALAGLKEGIITPHTTVFCPGQAHYYGRRFRCWRRQGHGSVNVHTALKVSCDVYFYALGHRLGIERISQYSKQFGWGALTGIDLSGERPGLVPSPEWSREVRRHPWYPGETISVAIGQGPLLVTPLHKALMTAIVANRGHVPTPHLVQASQPPRPDPPELAPAHWETVRNALKAVMEPGGTAFRSRVEGLDVAGKTGTVQVVAQATWMSPMDLPFHQRDHGWFTAFAPVDEPELVVAVFVEHGGGGSSAAAPVAQGIYEVFLDKNPHLRNSAAP